MAVPDAWTTTRGWPSSTKRRRAGSCSSRRRSRVCTTVPQRWCSRHRSPAAAWRAGTRRRARLLGPDRYHLAAGDRRADGPAAVPVLQPVVPVRPRRPARAVGGQHESADHVRHAPGPCGSRTTGTATAGSCGVCARHSSSRSSCSCSRSWSGCSRSLASSDFELSLRRRCAVAVRARAYHPVSQIIVPSQNQMRSPPPGGSRSSTTRNPRRYRGCAPPPADSNRVCEMLYDTRAGSRWSVPQWAAHSPSLRLARRRPTRSSISPDRPGQWL
jgi:hypothetical protein